jgi:hypothetical protein
MTPLESMRVVARHFNSLDFSYAFLGAAVLPLLIDDPDLFEIRPTKDVDLTVKVVTLSEFYQLEEKLRAIGFRNDTRIDAPICRWLVEDVTVDVMPTESAVLGMSAKWFREALESASLKSLGRGISGLVITAPYFLATKLEALRDRGLKDLYMSKDLEDILTLLDGCLNLARQVEESTPGLKRFVASELATHMENDDFREALPGYFRSDKVSRQRMLRVLDQIIRLAEM